MAIEMIDRYEGAMLGVAVGDALGAPLEFMSKEEINQMYGTVREMVGGGFLDVEPGEVTDDTQMTLAVAVGVSLDGKIRSEPYLAVGENFLLWFRKHPKDVGGCCRAVLSRMSRMDTACLSDWHKAAEAHDRLSGGWTAGNGALMRTVYPALYYQGDKAKGVAADIARMTHWHENSTKTVLRYTDAINAIVNSDWTVQEAKEAAESMMASVRSMIIGGKVEPTGYCVSSLICAMNAIRDTNNFEDALVAAVNMGGDADTIGAIAGGLAGAIYGAKQIPLRWINSLDNEPNRRTVDIFYENNIKTGNALAICLTDLAQTAYKRHAKNAKKDGKIIYENH